MLKGITPDFKSLPVARPQADGRARGADRARQDDVQGRRGRPRRLLVIWPELPTLMRMDRMERRRDGGLHGGLVSRLVFSIILILVPLAAADLVLSEAAPKSLMMTKEEVKRTRQQDIAPRSRPRSSAARASMAARRMMGDVPTADVVVTNPTHFAVALRYAQAAAGPAAWWPRAPTSSRSASAIAPREHGVTVMRTRRSRASSRRGRGRPARSRPSCFGAVAEVLAFVYRASGREPAAAGPMSDRRRARRPGRRGHPRNAPASYSDVAIAVVGRRSSS